MRVGLLGPLTVEVGGRPVEVGGARLRALLVRLAAEPGRPVTVDRLADVLWPGAAPADPANAVQSLVSRLRKTLGGHPALVSGSDGYRLDIPADQVDGHRFERLAAEGRRALRAGDRARAAAHLQEALELWRGPAQAGDALAARWEELRLAAIEDQLEAAGPAGQVRAGQVPAALIARLQELTAAHPLRERLAAHLVRALHADGRQAEALAAFEDCRRRLAEELGADPSEELRAAHLAALQPAAPRTSNLRPPLTSFVGRDSDVERLAALVHEHRLVTLVGPGGAGKTRLATTVAARDPHSVWLVELAPVVEAADVPATVLRALHHGGQFDAPQRKRVGEVVEQLAEALSQVPVLLVLDNCEHVVDAVAALSEDLLGRCPKLRILATSREPLAILGETLFPVGPLDPRAALQLLCDRAAAVRPGFTVTDAGHEPAAEICRRLDGLPLAIELAAARLRSFTAEQLAARLDDRFRLLTGGSRTALPRHRTLHAVVAWSWDLLGEQERDVATALAVFPGSFDAAAASAASGVRDAEPFLDALVDRSLLQVVAPGREPAGAPVRYRMLETIREFADEELTRAGRGAEVRQAHAAHYAALMARAEPHLRTAAQLRWLALLRPERANLHAAVTHLCDAGDAAAAYRLGAFAGWFWTFDDDNAQASELLRRILAVPPVDVPGGDRVLVRALYVVNSGFAGDFQFDRHSLDEIVRLAAEVPVAGAHPFVRLIEPIVLMFNDDGEAGARAVHLRLAEEPDPWTRGMLLAVLAHMQENEGDIDGMRANLEEAVTAFRAVGERWGLALTLASLADAYARRGEFAAAAGCFEESTGLHEELRIRSAETYQQIRLAVVRGHLEGPEVARAALLHFAAQPTALPRDVSHAMLELGHLARLEGDLAEAERCYTESWRLQALSPLVAPQYKALLYGSRALLDVARGELGGAARQLAEALTLTLPTRDMPVAAQIAVGSAALALARGDARRAARILGASHRLAGLVDRSNVDLRLQTGAVRAVLGAETCNEALAEGAALDRAAALELIRP